MVTIFHVPPCQAWDVTTPEFWTLYRFKFEESSGNKANVKPMDRKRFDEMKAAYELRQARKKDGVT